MNLKNFTNALEKHIANLDSAISKSTLLQDAETTRWLAGNKYLRGLKVGDTFVDNGFVASTRAKQKLPGFKDPTSLTMVLPKGTKVLDVVGHSSFDYRFKAEMEFLLGRGHTFKVLQVRNGIPSRIALVK